MRPIQTKLVFEEKNRDESYEDVGNQGEQREDGNVEK